MSEPPWLPITSEPSSLFIILVAFLLLFDWVLVRWLKLGKVAWKRVDYIWLGAAAIGLWGVATDVRRIAASSWLPWQREYRLISYQRVIRDVHALTETYVCRDFVRSDLSPENFNLVQKEFDSACAFGRELTEKLPTTPPDRLDRAIFRQRPIVTQASLRDLYLQLDQSLDSYEGAHRQYMSTVLAAERSSTEVAFSFASPVLFVMALALRFTKVTGEIRLDRSGETETR